MILNDEQFGVFADTLEALLYYVNEKFSVVKDFSLEDDTALGTAKSLLVVRELWGNVGVVDEFVAENPYHLSQRHLDIAASWKCALGGTFTLVRYQAGRALLMNDVGVFSVCGIEYEMQDEFGPAPAEVEVTLLPFEDIVIFDGLFRAFDYPSDPKLHLQMQNKFERLCGQGIVSTGQQFIQRASAYLEEKRNRELDDLLESLATDAPDGGHSEDAQQLPAGFHRGALAGLDEAARAAAIRTHEEKGAAPAYQKALWCAGAAALMYGVASIESVYEQFRALSGAELSFDDFASYLEEESAYGDLSFAWWEAEGNRYIVHYTLGEGYAVWLYTQRRELAARGEYVPELRSMGTKELDSQIDDVVSEALENALPSDGTDDEAYQGILLELARQEGCKRGILQAHAGITQKPLTSRIFEVDPMTDLLAHPSARVLRAFLDEHIPDGQDDYYFADTVLREVVSSAIEVGSLQDIHSYLSSLGLDRCGSDASKLPQLVRNVMDCLPSWESNGWSPREMYEQMTGRRTFYNPDGTVMRIGRDDPCPCGSGKKYRDCHGA